MTTTLPALTGSEKQIAWATDIRAASIAAWNAAAEEFDAIALDIGGDGYRAIAMRHMAQAVLATATNAEDWIDARDGQTAKISTLHWQAASRGSLPQNIIDMPEIAALDKIDIRQHGLLRDLDRGAASVTV